MPELRIARQRSQTVKPLHRYRRGVIEIDQVELVSLVPALVDREHRPAGAWDVMRARDRLWQRGQLDQIAQRKLVELHRPAHIAARQDALRRILAKVDVGEERPAGAQQRADGIRH